MANINLLGQNPSSHTTGTQATTLATFLAWVAAVALLGTVAVYWFFAFQEQQLNKQIETKNAEIQGLQKQLLSDPDRRELIVRQGQIKEIRNLLSSYPQWSRLLPKLAETNLKNNGYLAISAQDSKTLSMTLFFANFGELDKFLQIFSTPEYAYDFYDVKVAGIKKFQNDEASGIQAILEVSIKDGLLTKDVLTEETIGQ